MKKWERWRVSFLFSVGIARGVVRAFISAYNRSSFGCVNYLLDSNLKLSCGPNKNSCDEKKHLKAGIDCDSHPAQLLLYPNFTNKWF